MWDERYSEEGYVYGTTPNEFLEGVTGQLAKGKTLCIGEGEGRNGVYLATQGHQVTGVDASSVGMAKAQRLAEEKGVSIETQVSDLGHFNIEPESWDTVVSIFCHLPPPLRKDVHKRVMEGLRPGGMLVLEAYTPKQLEYNTGGPPVAEMMMTADSLREEFSGLEFLHLEELDREVHEGKYHHGMAAVVQLLARKPG
jgi:2-polyprenyl-3-methyl-5-hydroxy-6-metoxy-1,4-benzoquinol methylase